MRQRRRPPPSAPLLNSLVFAQIWGNLGRRGDKRQLRAVGRDVRALADSHVVALRMHEKSPTDLAVALALFPRVQRLEADCDVHSAGVISAAPLSRLQALTLRNLVRHTDWRDARHACVAHGSGRQTSAPCRTR
jgi:hypothetical protein